MRNKITLKESPLYFTAENAKKYSTVKMNIETHKPNTPEILFITSYPARECGIATYSQDLVKALNNKFEHGFNIKIGALEHQNDNYTYDQEVEYVLKTDRQNSYLELAEKINKNKNISIVLIQHEFGLFESNKADFITFLQSLQKPIVVVFHTVLPNPDALLKNDVQKIAQIAQQFIVMTQSSAKILSNDYAIAKDKIEVISHGTQLVEHTNKDFLKKKHNIEGRKTIATFGLLSSGKCIETSIDALQEIVKIHPEVLFLVIGKTHPTVFKNEGEEYRKMFQNKISDLNLDANVKFINQYLPLDQLLEYLQLTDIYLFTSKDRNQAVSGTFSYAISCGCPIISTPIPHAVEVLQNETQDVFLLYNSGAKVLKNLDS